MDRELEEYFDRYNELFNHRGYEQLLEEISNNISNLSEVGTFKDAEELFFRKGQIAAFRSILGFEDSVGIARSQAEEDVQDF